MAYQDLNSIIHDLFSYDQECLHRLKKAVGDLPDKRQRIKGEMIVRQMKHDLQELEPYEQHGDAHPEQIKEVPDMELQHCIPNFSRNPKQFDEYYRSIIAYYKRTTTFLERLRRLVKYDRSRDICDALIHFRTGQIQNFQNVLTQSELAT
ncbi:MAG: hypothetical protein ACLFPX_06060 [Candidatus Omnitrophota bacterium]